MQAPLQAQAALKMNCIGKFFHTDYIKKSISHVGIIIVPTEWKTNLTIVLGDYSPPLFTILARKYWFAREANMVTVAEKSLSVCNAWGLVVSRFSKVDAPLRCLSAYCASDLSACWQ